MEKWTSKNYQPIIKNKLTFLSFGSIQSPKKKKFEEQQSKLPEGRMIYPKTILQNINRIKINCFL